MKQLPVAGVVVAVLALFLSSAALFSGSGGGDEVRVELEKVREGISALDARIDALKADLESASKNAGAGARTVTDLSARIEKTEAEAARVRKSVVDLLEKPAAAAGTGIDPEKLRELVQAEIKAAFDRFRQQAGGRDRRDPAQALREDVGLDDEKIAKVTELRDKMRDEIGRMWRENRDGDRDANRKRMEEMIKKAEDEMAKVLTAEQMEKYRAWNEQQRRGRGRGPGGNRGGRGGQRPQQPREQQRPDDNAAF